MNTFKVNNIKKHVTFSDECGPNRPEYKELEARMATFERRSWPPSIPLKPHKLAEAGFYYTGKLSISLHNGRVFLTFHHIIYS